MPVEHLLAADRHPTPWRNGGGVTREVVSTGFSRVSLAEIAADGPFSAFPGRQRILTVVSGEGIELTVGDAPPVVVPPLRPFAFPGGAATSCRLLGGPVTALNLITRHPDPAVTLHPAATLRPTPGRPQLAIDLATLDAVLVAHPSAAPGPAAPCVVLTL
ncbi:HutD family protein [Kitasatospora sp. RB6PN24]|uniref:HutD/Ves family protein n=1 Tax=Kitasatospora humi TaxID=2893891 RepID=UPI001E556603|nr:HutD family protein [Kitasatospora humi]MCC9310150.1 HutD family protein [Kitasatospora humi]